MATCDSRWHARCLAAPTCATCHAWSGSLWSVWRRFIAGAPPRRPGPAARGQDRGLAPPRDRAANPARTRRRFRQARSWVTAELAGRARPDRAVSMRSVAARPPRSASRTPGPASANATSRRSCVAATARWSRRGAQNRTASRRGRPPALRIASSGHRTAAPATPASRLRQATRARIWVRVRRAGGARRARAATSRSATAPRPASASRPPRTGAEPRRVCADATASR